MDAAAPPRAPAGGALSGDWSVAALLPGAWFLLVAAGIVLVLRRHDALPWRVAALLGGLVLALLAPVLLGGRVPLPLGLLGDVVPWQSLAAHRGSTLALQWDLLFDIAPWQSVARRALLAGRWPAWNDLAGAGMPLLGDPQTQSLQPLVLLGLPLPLAQALGVTAALRVLLALLGTFLLLRRQGSGAPAALFGAVAFGLSGAVLLWLGWPLATSVALAPLLLYAVARAQRDGRARDVGLLVALTAAVLLGGHPETELYALAAAALLVGGFVWEARATPRAALGGALRSAAAMALGALLVAPVLLAEADYLPQTQRAHLLVARLQPIGLAELWRDLHQPRVLAGWGERVTRRELSLVAPRAFGDPDARPQGPDGGENWIELASAGVGGLVAALALASLWPAASRLAQERLAAGALGAALLLVAQPPGFDRLVGRLAVVGPTAQQQHHRLLLLAALAACLLAAAEVERWTRGERRTVACCSAGGVVAALLAIAYLGHPASPAGAHATRWLVVQLVPLLLGLGLLVAVAPKRARTRTPTFVPLALAVLCGGELLALHGSALRSAPAGLFCPRVPPVRFLAAALGDDRLLGLGTALQPSTGQLLGLDDARTQNPAQPWSFSRLGAVLRARSPGSSRFSWGDRGDASLYDLLGVRFLLTAPGRELPHARLVLRDASGWVHERRQWLPRLFLPAAALADDGDGWDAWLAAPRDLGARALVAGSPTLSRGQRWRAAAPAAAQLRLVAREATLLRARAALPEGRLLASSVYQDGGWRVLADGKPLATVRTDGAFVGAWLPAGTRDVALLYRPRGLLLGVVLSAVAAAALCGWLLPPPASAGRSRASTMIEP